MQDQNRDKEQIRQAVRTSYGKLAEKSGADSEPESGGSCCGPQVLFTNVSAGLEISGCCGSEATPQQLSELMGYSQEAMDSVPDGANMGLGCGNPVALSSLQPGEVAVDLGCGAGFDCFLAAREVGQSGRVIGIDMTPDMISKARRNAQEFDLDNIEFRLGEIEHLPVADNTADIVMSNCVINLSPDKQQVYRDAYRILKPGGRLCISDVVATAPIPEDLQQDLELVSACVGGAATIEALAEMLEKAGFQNIQIHPKEESRELISQWVSAKNREAGDYVVSAYIKADKPAEQ